MRKIFIINLVMAALVFCRTSVFAQAFSSLSYSSPQTYSVGTTVSLSPSVVGGPAAPGGNTTQSFAGSYQGYADGPAGSAMFNLPTCAVADSEGNVYVGDSQNNRIRRITPFGEVTTFAGSGTAASTDGTGLSASFNHPAGITIDASGNLYVSDQYSHKIRKITPAAVVTTLAGSGTAGSANGTGSAAQFNNPTGLACDAAGNIYVGDYSNHRIRKITPAGVVTTFAGSGTGGFGNGTGTGASFNGPMGLAFDASGNLYVADRLNYRIRKITTAAVVTTFAGSGASGYGDNPTGTSATFNRPTGIAIDASGNLYVTDENNHMVRKITPATQVTTFAGYPTSSGFANGTGSTIRFASPYAVTADKQMNLYVVELLGYRVRKVVTQPYNIYPNLPAGLSFNNTTGVISGTPTAVTPLKSYFIRAYNMTHSSPLATVDIEINTAPPGIIGTSNQNYITTYTPNITGYTTESAVLTGSLDKNSVQTNIQYFDGLGRPMQSVAVMGSPGGRDIVQPVAYDAMGREDKKYLPYAATATASNGSYKATALADQNSFYTSPGGGAWNAPGVVAVPDAAFSKTVFEASPLNRVLEQGAPGAAWQPLSGSIPGSGHTVKFEYGASNVDAIKIWAVNSNGATVTGTYGTNALYKNRVADENGNSSWEYKDKEGRVIRKVVEEPAGTYLATFYVYDDLGNLRYVLPPGANPDVLSGFSESDAVFTNFIYAYKYDERNRVFRKKIPGKGWEEMIYNPLDQLVFSQDTVQAQTTGSPYPYRSFIKYDGLGRVVMTGVEKDHTGSREVVQDYVNNVTTGFWETRDNSVNNYHGYNNISCPWNTLNLQPEVVNYYDDYAIPGIPNNQSASYTKMTRGLLTAIKTKVLGSADHFLWTINYYDDEGRVVKVWQQHYKGGTVAVNSYDETTNTYDFKGQVLTSIRRHYVAGVEQLYQANEYTYDHAGRPKDSYQKTGDNISTANPKILMSRKNYNEIGQLSSKGLHASNLTTPVFAQTVTYAYNARGWLKSQGSDLFNQSLNYEETISGVTPQYNGNISRQVWGPAATPSLHSYTYGYDKLNRLTSAYSDESNNEDIAYNVMGNITSLQRKSANVLVDQLTYNYTGTGNRLNSVADANANTVASFQLSGTTSYMYDVNGNLLSRVNPTNAANNMTAMVYNHLNLPTNINANGAVITYTYDGMGNKLKKLVTGGANVNNEYIGGIHYESGVLTSLNTAEGRVVRISATNYSYEYTLADHLGNGRVYFDINGGAARQVQGMNYYGYGLPIISSPPLGTENRYQYNGKEKQDQEKLFDYGARFYDPVIARFTTIDPLAANFPWMTPYQYASNDPIKNIDLDGLEGIPFFLEPALMFGNSSVTPRIGPLARTARLAPENIVKAGGELSGRQVTELMGRTAETAAKSNDHHLIPRQLKGNEVVEAAREGGFKFEGKENKMTIEQYSKSTGQGQHGNHPGYNKGVGEQLIDFANKNPEYTTADALKFVRGLVDNLKQTINNSPTTKINDLLKLPAQDGTKVVMPVMPLVTPLRKPTTIDPKNYML